MGEFDRETTYFKVTNESECHHGFQYQDGLNLLKEPFAKTGSCVPGGLYFTNLDHVVDFISYGIFVREVLIPPESQVVKDGKFKWRTDQIWLGHRWVVEDFLRHHAHTWTSRDWEIISYYPHLSESFIREFPDRVNWSVIGGYQELSEPFIREFADRLDWSEISRSQKLSEPFIREFADRLDWSRISLYQELSILKKSIFNRSTTDMFKSIGY